MQRIKFIGDSERILDSGHETAVRNLFDLTDPNVLSVHVKRFTISGNRRAMYFAGAAFSNFQNWRQGPTAWLCVDTDIPAVKCVRAKWFESALDSKLLEVNAQSIVDWIENADPQDPFVISGKNDSLAIADKDKYMFLKRNDFEDWPTCEDTWEKVFGQ